MKCVREMYAIWQTVRETNNEPRTRAHTVGFSLSARSRVSSHLKYVVA